MGLFDIFSGDDARQAAQDKITGLNSAYTQASGSLAQGRDALTSNFGDASGLYKNLLTSYAPGANAYGDATGANGADGYARAKTNFQTNPGYQFQMDQGLQALDRTHAAAGNLSSGNADSDTLKFATGLADQSYGQYTSGLLPYLTGQGTATAGAAGVDQNLGTALNTSYGNQAGLGYQTQAGIGNATAAGDMADQQASANLWGGLLNGAKAVTGSGGLFGSQGLVSGVKNLFSGFGS